MGKEFPFRKGLEENGKGKVEKFGQGSESGKTRVTRLLTEERVLL